MRYYGRCVDDFILVHEDKAVLQSLLARIKSTLQETVHLSLHSKKIYLQHYTKGVQFLGVIIKPNRIYIAKRSKGNFYNSIQKQNAVVSIDKPDSEQKGVAFLNRMNSYLGLLKHYKTHKLRKRMLFKNLSVWWWNHVYLSGGIARFVLKVKPAKRRLP